MSRLNMVFDPCIAFPVYFAHWWNWGFYHLSCIVLKSFFSLLSLLPSDRTGYIILFLWNSLFCDYSDSGPEIVLHQPSILVWQTAPKLSVLKQWKFTDGPWLTMIWLRFFWLYNGGKWYTFRRSCALKFDLFPS